jgi:hypothetical protein
MAGLPWIKVHTDLPTHPKAIRLRIELQDEWAWAHVVRLWMWAAQHSGDGRFEGVGSGVVIEDSAGWKGKPGDFVAACVRCGFLDETSSGYAIHDWEEHAGAHVAKRQREAERKRKSRDRPRDVPRTSEGPEAPSGGTSLSLSPSLSMSRIQAVKVAYAVKETLPSAAPIAPGEGT